MADAAQAMTMQRSRTSQDATTLAPHATASAEARSRSGGLPGEWPIPRGASSPSGSTRLDLCEPPFAQPRNETFFLESRK